MRGAQAGDRELITLYQCCRRVIQRSSSWIGWPVSPVESVSVLEMKEWPLCESDIEVRCRLEAGLASADGGGAV